MPTARLIAAALFVLAVSLLVQFTAHQHANPARLHVTHFAARFGLVRMQWIARGAEVAGELVVATDTTDPYPTGGSLLVVEPDDEPLWLCASILAATPTSTAPSIKTALALWPDMDASVGTPGDNVWQGNELEPLYLATDDIAALRQPSAFAVADAAHRDPLLREDRLYIASRWCAGTLKTTDATLTCTPARTLLNAGTTSGARITLRGVFAQKGTDFRCPSSAPTVR